MGGGAIAFYIRRMIKIASNSRWNKAQSYEKSHWQSLADRIKKGNVDLNWYDWNAKNLMEMVKKAISTDTPSFASSKVLEVGSGPIGIVSFLEAAERFAIDPLCDYFSSQSALVKHRNKDVIYKNAKGEDLPFEDSYFDLVIIENVIDHVQYADGVMTDLNRVLKSGALLYLRVNLHTAWGAILHEVVSRLRIDKGHPHTFTLANIRIFLKRHGFEILHDEWQDYRVCRRENLESASNRDRLKGLSGLSEFMFTSVSKKVS